MIGIKYLSTGSHDPSGYASAARQFVQALYVAGVNITTESIAQMNETSDYGIGGMICQKLEDREIDYKIKIIHLTPDLYPAYMEDGKYNIGHLFFETSKLPDAWVEPCNQMNELWTASERQKEMFIKSGVTVPIYCFPQPIDITKASELIKPFTTKEKRGFTFYAIFHWILRKNPEVLLKAYWKEFEGNDDVVLLIKTYRITYDEKEYDLIRQDIANWKKDLGLKHYPKIFLVKSLLTDYEVQKLHKMGDCFISSSSGEGWARPVQEAMLMGYPVISGDNGGITDLMDDAYYYKVESHTKDAKMQPFIPWYEPSMQWWELDENDLRKKLREVHDNYREAQEKGLKALSYVADNFSYQKVGEQMKKRLEEIYGQS